MNCQIVVGMGCENGGQRQIVRSDGDAQQVFGVDRDQDDMAAVYIRDRYATAFDDQREVCEKFGICIFTATDFP